MSAGMLDLFGLEPEPKRAMGSHQSRWNGSDEWLTPPALIHALGAFDLDPCAPIVRPWPTAARHFSIEDDGLRQDWGEGSRVWLNPPYSTVGLWLTKLVEHGTGTALVFARTETQNWFDLIWPHASAIMFLHGRVAFHRVGGRRAKSTAGAPSALIAYGQHDAHALAASGVPGALVSGWTRPTSENKKENAS